MSSWRELTSKLKLYFVPPGEGVFTVHTASEKRAQLQSKIFGQNSHVRQAWEKQIEQLELSQGPFLLGICSDTGGGIQRGANWAPLFLRDHLLNSGEKLEHFDLGDVRVIPQLLHDKYLNQETIESCREALYQDKSIALPVSPLSIAEDFYQHFYQLKPDAKIFMIGGDHSVSYPAVKHFLIHKKNQGKKVALIHFDAHTDLLEKRLGIDLCFGTWTSHIIPFLSSSEHLIQIGIRSSGKDKYFWEKKFGHKQIWTDEIIKAGASSIASDIVQHLKKLQVEELYVSFDIDCLDQEYAGATGTPEPKGLEPHAPMVILQELHENFKITGADIVEIAPFVKHPEIKSIEPQTTLMVAQSFATFFLQAMYGHH